MAGTNSALFPLVALDPSTPPGASEIITRKRNKSQVLDGASHSATGDALKHRGLAGEDTSQSGSSIHACACIHFKSFMISNKGNRMIKGRLKSFNRYECERETLQTCV